MKSVSTTIQFHVARALVGVGALNLGASIWTGGAWWWTFIAMAAIFAGDALLRQFEPNNGRAK